jgi:LmbE family N-acetylglucosaminyl deacetylase
VVNAPGQTASVLAAMAHPDDPELWAGATLAVLSAPVSEASVADLIAEVRPDVLIMHLLTDVRPGTGRRRRPLRITTQRDARAQ